MQFFNRLLASIFILPIRLYQIFLSPMLGANKCRFQPTCSHYAIEALREWGFFKGFYLAVRRVFRCHPWGGHGFDPVPKREK